MSAIPFPTLGDGKIHKLNEKGVSLGMTTRVVYEVTFICLGKDFAGNTYANSVSVGVDNELATVLNVGDTITLLTDDLGAVCWQDFGSVAFLSIVYQEPVSYVYVVQV